MATFKGMYIFIVEKYTSHLIISSKNKTWKEMMMKKVVALLTKRSAAIGYFGTITVNSFYSINHQIKFYNETFPFRY